MNPDAFQLSIWDILVFVAFVVTVVSVGLYQSRSEKGSEDYFLAGRDLKWWLIGFSLIASNISTEQFVGMAGQGAGAVPLFKDLGVAGVVEGIDQQELGPLVRDFAV